MATEKHAFGAFVGYVPLSFRFFQLGFLSVISSILSFAFLVRVFAFEFVGLRTFTTGVQRLNDARWIR